MRLGSLCALLWCLLTWCNIRQVVLKARHILGRLNVIADKLSRQGQVIQTKSNRQTIRSPVQKGNSHSSGLAQHAMVLGSDGSVIPDTLLSPKPSRSSDSALQRSKTQRSDQPQSTCMSARAEAIKEQQFSNPVAKQIQASQRHSTRAVYEAKWSVIIRW